MSLETCLDRSIVRVLYRTFRTLLQKVRLLAELLRSLRILRQHLYPRTPDRHVYIEAQDSARRENSVSSRRRLTNLLHAMNGRSQVCRPDLPLPDLRYKTLVAMPAHGSPLQPTLEDFGFAWNWQEPPPHRHKSMSGWNRNPEMKHHPTSVQVPI